jgi:hypothetical protein
MAGELEFHLAADRDELACGHIGHLPEQMRRLVHHEDS